MHPLDRIENYLPGEQLVNAEGLFPTRSSSMEIINNTVNQQFEVREGDYLAVLQYRIRGENMYFLHTGVPKEIGNKGIAAALAKHGLDYARRHAFKIVVYCPYVAAYLKRHPEYMDLVNEEYWQKHKPT